MTGPSGVDQAAAPAERISDGFRVFAALSQGDDARAVEVLAGMTGDALEGLSEVGRDLAYYCDHDPLQRDRVWRVAAVLALHVDDQGLCSHCDGLVRDGAGTGRVPWPCPTARALGAAS